MIRRQGLQPGDSILNTGISGMCTRFGNDKGYRGGRVLVVERFDGLNVVGCGSEGVGRRVVIYTDDLDRRIEVVGKILFVDCQIGSVGTVPHFDARGNCLASRRDLCPSGLELGNTHIVHRSILSRSNVVVDFVCKAKTNLNAGIGKLFHHPADGNGLRVVGKSITSPGADGHDRGLEDGTRGVNIGSVGEEFGTGVDGAVSGLIVEAVCVGLTATGEKTIDGDHGLNVTSIGSDVGDEANGKTVESDRNRNGGAVEEIHVDVWHDGRG